MAKILLAPINVLQNFQTPEDFQPRPTLPTMNPTRNLLQVAGLTLLTAGTLPAAVFVSNPTGGWYDGGSLVSIGTLFSVGSSPVSIKALGLFDQNGDGLERSEQVGIFALGPTPTLLGKVSIQEGTGSVFHDGSRWENLTTPITLSANTSYMLAWSVQRDAVPVNVSTANQVTVNPPFTLEGIGYSYTETGTYGLNFPNLSQRSVGLYAFGGNMELVPEPAAGLIVAAGLLGFAGWRRRRSSVEG